MIRDGASILLTSTGHRDAFRHRNAANDAVEMLIALGFDWQSLQRIMTHLTRLSAFLRRSVLGVLPFLLVFLLGAAPTHAVESWSLSDGAGHRLNAKVFEQPFPDYPSGLRIRLNALDAKTILSHGDQLLLSDSMGQEWSLPNRSEEIVQKGGSPLPPGSAQFDLDALMPRPSEALPLHLTVPTSVGALGFDLTPQQAMALHAMGSEQRPSDRA